MKHIILIFSFLIVSSFFIQAQNNNIFVHKTGNIEVILLSEGQQSGNSDILLGANHEILKECLSEDLTFPNATNVFLVKANGKNYLIDAGYGRHLLTNLAQTYVNPEDINAICITHMHGDHIGGLLLNDEVIFKNAVLYLPEREYNYWMSDESMKAAGENSVRAFTNARNVIAKYKEQLTLIYSHEIDDTDKLKILNGTITAIAAYGHTPGHTMYLVDDKILIWGDLTHAMAIQMKYPEIAVTYDVSPDEAVTSREKILKTIADKDIIIGGMHIAYPAMGKIKKNKDKGYDFESLDNQRY